VDRPSAAAGSALFFAAAPGVVAGLIPWSLSGWEVAATWWPPLRVLGAVLVVAGGVTLLHAFTRFVVEGLGTPAPIAPTEHLVVGGLYRYVRNVMYLAVTAAIVGQALLLGRPGLLAYAAVVWAAMAAFVLAYEEPALARRYGAQYEQYRRAVPAWWPRLRAGPRAARSGRGSPGRPTARRRERR
jgi:protein-S-isoprenylcysteine O-methyltransferase Ste14